MDSHAIIFFIFRCFNLGLVSFFIYYVFKRSFYPTFKKEIEDEIDSIDRLSESIVQLGKDGVELKNSIEQQSLQAAQLLNNMRKWRECVQAQQQGYVQARQTYAVKMRERSQIQSKMYQEQVVLCALVPRVLERAQDRLKHEFAHSSTASREFIDTLMQDMQAREKN